MKLEPLFARVLMRREALKSKSLVLPDSAAIRNAPARGRVIAIGPTADKSIKVGETYVFGQHSGAWLNTEGKPATDADYFVCQDEDLICRVTE